EPMTWQESKAEGERDGAERARAQREPRPRVADQQQPAERRPATTSSGRIAGSKSVPQISSASRRTEELGAGLGERRRPYPHDPREARRQPPVPAAEDRHQARHEHAADDRRVEKNRDREAETELLQPDDPSCDEPRERRTHDDRRRRDDPAGALEAV